MYMCHFQEAYLTELLKQNRWQEILRVQVRKRPSPVTLNKQLQAAHTKQEYKLLSTNKDGKCLS